MDASERTTWLELRGASRPYFLAPHLIVITSFLTRTPPGSCMPTSSEKVSTAE